MNDKGHSSEVSSRNEGKVIGNWSKEILLVKHPKKLGSIVSQCFVKVRSVSDDWIFSRGDF